MIQSSGTRPKTAPVRSHFLRQLPGWLWVFLPFAVIGLGVAAFVIIQPITVLPRITLAPGFRLLDENGQPMGNEHFRGQMTLYSFSYMGCNGDCSPSGAQIAAVREGLNGRLTTPLQLVTFTLDPEQDTPEKLRPFTSKINNNLGSVSWQWLTGNEQKMRTTVGGGFDLYYAAQQNGDIKFRPLYVLVDENGVVRARYFTDQPKIDLLLRDINFLTQEAKDRKEGKNAGYDAAHLFLCYPR